MSGSAAVVFIRDLGVDAILGAFDWEREVEQRVLLNVRLHCDIAAAAATDDLPDALDYKAVSKRLLELVKESRCHLLETLAEQLADALLREFSASRVVLQLEKPGAVRDAASVGIVIERAAVPK